MSALRPKLQLVLTFSLLFIGLSVVAFLDTAMADQTGTRSATISHTPTDIAIDGDVTKYVSPEFTTQFKFNGIGLTWAGNAQADVTFSLQVDNKPWEVVEMMGNDGKSGPEVFTSAPLFMEGKRIRYRIIGDVDHVQNVTLTYFDSSIPPYQSFGKQVRSLFATEDSTNGLTVISRSEWGADENLRTWAPEYATPQKIVIHHTAGGNGGEDPAATIRGIYYWHTVVLGWGDIGYNYLVDQSGNIYEGRYGGLGAIGAHAYNSDTNTNYNVGSVGVSLLGCYEGTEGACATITPFTDAMRVSLTNLIAHTSARYGFDANGSSEWFGEVLPNVVGHRDIDYTFCPGSAVHDLLPDIRQTASIQAASLIGLYSDYVGQLLNSTLASSYNTTDTPPVELTYTNAGAKPWESGLLKLKVKIGKRQVATTLTNTVDPHSNATLQVGLALPRRAGSYPITAKLVRKGKTVKGSVYRNTVTVTNQYQVGNVQLVAPVAIRQGWVPTLSLTATNTGSLELPVGTAVIVNKQTLTTTNTAWPVGETRTLTLPFNGGSSWPKGYQTLRLKLNVATIFVEGSTATASIRVD